MDRIDGKSMDIAQASIAQIKDLFPEIVIDKMIDFERLKEILDGHVDPRAESYTWNWKGKQDAIRLARKPSMGTLRPVLKESKDWEKTENLYIEGDNLEVLKLLQTAYLNSVKMIYIDPPYNTGNDFVYEDDFADSLRYYKDVTGQALKSNPETAGRYHTNWLNMMYPRLKLARNLLTSEGLIFISIDENEICNLRKQCDEIFGEECFVAQISLLCNPKGRSQDMYVATCHEYILIYSKTILPKGAVSIEKSSEDVKNDYPLEDGDGRYRELELRNTHREFGKHNRPNLYYPFYIDIDGKVYVEQIENSVAIYPIWEDGFEGCWTWGQENAKENVNLLTSKKVNGTWKIYRKSHAVQDGEIVKKQLKSIWTEKEFHTEKGQAVFNDLFNSKEKIFQSPKSVDLIKVLIKMSQAKDSDIILDFFSGSATTAHAVMQLNADDGAKRKFIMVQLPEQTDERSEARKAGYKNICEIGKERVRLAGQKIKAGKSAHTNDLDIGFKVFKLDSSNLKIWDNSPSEDECEVAMRIQESILYLVDGRGEIDMVYEIMLKFGLPLTLPVQEVMVKGATGYIISNPTYKVFICLHSHITLESVEAMLTDLPPVGTFIFADKCFVDASALINTQEILKKSECKMRLF
ncbi:MAG: site-specific DNA-methyltransferase [Christensenellaceae bacterium]|jgi:adenine-specific DNA-methyltransferase|nr:site-specific DNA-methyltransferase [Christensenellaceae bacterium]